MMDIKEVEELFDKKALYVVFSHDGSDALIQENGYTIEDCRRFIENGDEIFIDGN